MRNGLFRPFIFVLVLLTAVSSEVPLVLCFGEDGHVRFEMAGVDPTHHIPTHFMDENNVPFQQWDVDKENCGRCLDLPFFSDFFIIKKNLLPCYFPLVINTITPAPSWLATVQPQQFRKNQCAPPFFISSFNKTLQNIVLLV